jgi:hypothetical protein
VGTFLGVRNNSGKLELIPYTSVRRKF